MATNTNIFTETIHPNQAGTKARSVSYMDAPGDPGGDPGGEPVWDPLCDPLCDPVWDPLWDPVCDSLWLIDPLSIRLLDLDLEGEEIRERDSRKLLNGEET